MYQKWHLCRPIAGLSERTTFLEGYLCFVVSVTAFMIIFMEGYYTFVAEGFPS